MSDESDFCRAVWEGKVAPGVIAQIHGDQHNLIGALHDMLTKGPCKEPKPLNEAEQARWLQWQALASTSRDVVQSRFVAELTSAIAPFVDAKRILETFQGSDEARENLRQRIVSAQRILRMNAAAKDLETSFYLMPEGEGQSTGEKWSDDDSSGSDNYVFEEVDTNVRESSQLGRSMFQSFESQGSPRTGLRQSSIHIHDHELQERLPELFQSQELEGEGREDDEEEEEVEEVVVEDELHDSQKLVTVKNLQNHMEELAKITNNTLTRLESLEKEISVLHKELIQRNSQTNQIIWILLSVTVPCCLISVWALLRSKAR